MGLEDGISYLTETPSGMCRTYYKIGGGKWLIPCKEAGQEVGTAPCNYTTPVRFIGFMMHFCAVNAPFI